MLSLIDLAAPNLKVVERALLDDGPIHVSPHPDGQRFVVGAVKRVYLFEIRGGKLVQISRSPQEHGLPCFWVTPKGDRIIATQGRLDGKSATIHWYAIVNNQVHHLSEVQVRMGVDTKLVAASYILRVSLDGKRALVCHDSGLLPPLCDIPIVDLTLREPAITRSSSRQVRDLRALPFIPTENWRWPHVWPNTRIALRYWISPQKQRVCYIISMPAAVAKASNSHLKKTNCLSVRQPPTAAKFTMSWANTNCAQITSSSKTDGAIAV